MANSASSAGVPSIPIATIYQNSDQVAGILQQIMQNPLLTEESREFASKDGNDTTADGSTSGKGEGSGRIPFFGGAKASAEVEAGLSSSWTQTTGTASRQQFVYSQAYNLHLVRQSLKDKEQLTRLTSTEQAEKLQPGEFVEYTTTFDPVELTLALDVISPELVEAITRFNVKRDYLLRFPEEGGHEARVQHAEKMDLNAQAKGELARAITNAVKADTRQETTREYYGRVDTRPELTLITICDLVHFIVDDPDRLLDGTFTVLGKVISPVEQDMPTFSHNKLLRNLTPTALDHGLEKLRDLIDQAPSLGQAPPSEYVDFKLDSRVRGSSMRVMPLAIYS
ncbi:DUF6414 family protein [Kocuria sp. HSID16901]|uniref:DUF6414 family protein n=1 Tax=Kocuria sp. HSID16901 TaxID=2419505 RepID=UPI000AE972BB|nr:hypothetical protein [Kocuria sp. HSID16901]RUQ20897.1 hypothetical protein D8M21_08325 [Kocuria sp. HSID16901]